MIERRRSLRNDAAYMLAVLYTCGFLGVVYLVIIKDISKDSMPIVQQLISIMSMIQGAIAGFFYGASKAAAETNQSMARIAEQATPAGGSAQTPAPIVAETVAIDANTATVTTGEKP